MSTTRNQPLPAVFLMGPTASGKTALAVELVQRFPFSIISVDSALVYRGLDIGTAKPDATTLQRAPHRLIDILDPSEAYSAARFRTDALREIEAIRTEGRIPLLVGGTLLYFRALEQGLSPLPPADPELRARLEAQAASEGLDTLYARLATLDPLAAARIHPHDAQRIQRALEVFELTGRPITELYAAGHDEKTALQALKLVIAPSERQVLYRRIEQRFQQMLERGFIAEVEGLRRRPELSLDKPSMRAVGYRQIWEYLDGLTDYPEMVRRAVVATRRFAKRQLTWLRAERSSLWFDSGAAKGLDQVVKCLDTMDRLPR